MSKVNNKETRTTLLAPSFWCLYYELWTCFTSCYSDSTVNFEHVIAGWKTILFKIKTYATNVLNNTPLIPPFSIFVSLLLDNDVYYNFWENRIIVFSEFCQSISKFGEIPTFRNLPKCLFSCHLEHIFKNRGGFHSFTL